MNPNINNISSFLTSIAEGHLYQSFYHQRMGLLRLGLVSECRVTKNTTNDTNFSHIFFNILNVIVDYFKTTLTSADTKQKKWLLIPKVASTLVSLPQPPGHHDVVIEEGAGVAEILPGLRHLPRPPPPVMVLSYYQKSYTIYL